MKNYLLSLLIIFSIATQAQTYQNPTFGKLTLKTNTLSTSTAKISTQETDGQINYIPATSLPVPTSVVNALDLKVENSSGAIQGFAITNNGNGTVNIATGTAYLRQTNDPYSPIIKYVIPAVTNLALTDNANNFVLVDYNGGSPSLTVTVSPGTINTTTNSIAYLISRVGTTLDYINLVGQNVDANGKLRRRFLNSESLRRSQGAVLTSSNRNLLVTAGLFYSGLIEVSTPLFNTSTVDTFTQVYINGTWTRSTGNTQINNTQYSLGGVLTAMPTNDYRVDYVYVLADNPSKLYVLLGTTTYNNIGNARLSPVPVDLPSELQYLGTRIGRVIIQKNATTMETSSEYATIYQAGSAQLHNDLGGLNLGDFQHLTVAEKANLEVITNKQNSLAIDGTGIKYPTVDATNAGLALKQNTLTNPITGTGTTNTIPKWTGTTTQGNSNITDNGTTISTSTDMVVNMINIGRGGGNLASNTVIGQLSGQQMTTSSVQNTAMGSSAFRYLNLGGNSVAVGNSAGTTDGIGTNLTSISNSIIIGQSASPESNSQTNQIVIAQNGKGLGSNTTVIGNSSTTFGRWYGKLLVGKSSNDGVGDIQANSFISSGDVTLGVSQPTANNQVTRKDYVDTALSLKANIASPTFTGVPSVPLATTGTNSPQIASTAFVSNNFLTKASPIFTGDIFGSGNYVTESSFKLGSTNTGLERYGSSAASFKEISNVWTSNVPLKATTLNTNSYTVASLPTPIGTAYATVTDALAPTYLGALVGGGTVVCPVFYDGTVWRSTINAIDTNNIVYKTGNQTITGQKSFENNSTNSNIVSSNYSTGIGIQSFNSSSGDGIFSNNTSTGTAINSVNFSTGKNLVLNNSLDATGTPFTIQKANVDKLTINDNGEITGNKYIKTGGTPSQFLKADGSVDGTEYADNNFSWLDKMKRGIQFFTDFEGNANAQPYLNSFNLGNGATTTRTLVAVPNQQLNQIGFCQYQTGTTNTGYASHFSEGNVGVQFNSGGGSWIYESSIEIQSLSTVLERFRFISGFGNSPTNANDSNAIFFIYDEGGVSNGTTASPYWQCITSNNNVRTLTTTNVLVNELFNTLRIEINAAGTSVVFKINGNIVATHTTNIPVGLNKFNIKQGIVKSIGTTNRSVFCDYLGYENYLTTPR